ncbi:MAG: 3-deoxy-manno-octulosonate cytidylyltransferase [Sulfurospirillaceae bacterium]|nr:3-deoxy-manno-octulosonate cytidylyltransferase [Sulfurospirillaceae bacterium]MDD2825902.1 3-deoxy-manno-octulosonate cytidylyltransferase [Sulfurospirillaceae bacterium]
MIIIPARMSSTRFPNKVLTNINGEPMVIATANRVKNLDNVAIATDSQQVIDIAHDYGFKAIMTSSEHQSGTDRINEAALKLKLHDDEIVINVQADEPFIEENVVESVIERVQKSIKTSENIMMVSCYKTIDSSLVDDPNLVKVIMDINDYAIYFSRSRIPFNRDGAFESYFGHLGIYGFTKKSLTAFCTLSQAPLEMTEKLEQLRALYFGYKIAMVHVQSKSFGIDTQEDLERALQAFSIR